ncbi:MAG: polyhydroxyalkanoate synthesis regulator [Candidatus Acetothermia bacterium]|nr:polyhydroxyalkanoate synthesis regulator [Candidatus Acetothermia bacterium]MDH7504569.1 polyhydroxyalkanoate synthesis regulator [Candidatus Acetothermia bacterium]
MMALLREGLLLGLGALDLTRERVTSLVDELIKRGEQVQKEREVAIDELLAAGKRAEERLRATIARVVGELGLPTKADLARIEERLAALEKKLK